MSREIRSEPLTAALFIGLVLTQLGCVSTPREPRSASIRSDGSIVTAEDIKRSGAQDAWEVIKRNGRFYYTQENSAGEPTRIWRRGRNSVELSSAPFITVDGIPLSDLRLLRQIPAHTILSMRMLGGADGTKYHGALAGAGAIHFATKHQL